MPPPVALFFGPAAIHGAYIAASTISSTTLAAVLAKQLWKKLPAWIREDPAFRSFSRQHSGGGSSLLTSSGDDETEEMATLGNVILKLEDMITTAARKLASGGRSATLTPAQLHASILAYVQLSNQLRERNPDARDRIYAKSTIQEGERVSIKELQDLRQSIDLATWSYVDHYGPDEVRAKLETLDYDLHSYKLSNVPGRVGHYIALSPEKKSIVIGIKGTSTLEDLITDAAGKAVGFDMHRDEISTDGEDTELGFGVEVTDAQHVTIVVSPISECCNIDACSIHGSGEATASEAIEVELCRGERIIVTNDGSMVRCHEGVLLCARRLAQEVRHVVETLAVKLDYSVLVVGHSLGAGVGCILAVLLRSTFPKLAECNTVRVHAFAPPPVLDIDGCTGCSPFVTSVVNGADMIPRGSVANLAVLLELLAVINEKLEERGMGLAGPRRATALLRKLSQGTSGDMLMDWEEVRDLVDQTHHKVDLRDPDHLYVPGRVLLMYEPWAERGEESNSSSNQDNVTPGGGMRCAVTYGTAAPLRLFEVDALRMFTDHLTSSIEAGIDSLIAKSESD